MNVKALLKKVFGEEKLSMAKGQVMHYYISTTLKISRKSKSWMSSSDFKVSYHLKDSKYHVFRGYYDLNYLSDNEEIFLVHRLPLKATNNKNNKIEIGYYDLSSNKFCRVSNSSAWCWQQGSRLRFHPKSQNVIVFNDVDDDHYCTRMLNLKTRKQKKICRALYDISSDGNWGISLNYSRLQRKRPGYGYNYFEDLTIGLNAPEDDGIFYVNIKDNHSELKYSLKELAELGNVPNSAECYVNHVSIAPDDSKFIFFLIYTQPGVKDWRTVLFLESEGLQILEQKDRVSHYCWMDSNNLMVTCHMEDNTEYYCIFDLINHTKKILDVEGLNTDGHPSPYKNKFITDTYPLDKSMQNIYMFKQNSKKVKKIAKLYHDYRLRGEKRCDLHPVVEMNGKYVSVDTTFEGGKRSILVMKEIGE